VTATGQRSSASRLEIADAQDSLLHGWLGALVLRPAYDRVALKGLLEVYFPLSRAWAAGLAADGSSERFRSEVQRPELPTALIEPALATIARRRARLAEAVAAWEAAFFGAAEAPVAERIACERARLRAANRLMMARQAFLQMHVRGSLDPVRWDIPDEAAARLDFADVLADPRDPVPPATTPIAESRPVPTTQAEDRWLRFEAPAADGEAWARVSTPTGASDPPTLVFAHGVCIEDEYWAEMPDLTQEVLRRGVRVIRAEAPWHGRRRLPGWFGGEPALGRGPLGMVELIRAWSAELAILVAWARRTSAGPVAVGGVSMGALTAQRLATSATDWPVELRPDALFLIATSGDLGALAEENALARALGAPAVAAARGWTAERLADWLPLAAPVGPPAMAPERIVMVLGSADDLVPYAGGAALARNWAVPPQNLFVRPQGHFSVSLGLIGDAAPQHRLAAVLGA